MSRGSPDEQLAPPKRRHEGRMQKKRRHSKGREGDNRQKGGLTALRAVVDDNAVAGLQALCDGVCYCD